MAENPFMEDSERLLGLAEVAELLGTSRQTIANWRARRGDFPAAMANLKSGPIWRRADVVSWAESNDVPLAESIRDEVGREAVVVGVMNMKGGVGKSTLTANLGWYCAHQLNQRVLLVDLDPQFNLSQYIMGTAKYESHLNEGNGTVLDIFEQATPPSVAGRPARPAKSPDVISHVQAWRDGSLIDIIPSSLDLAWTLKNPSSKEQLLAHFLDDVKSNYDLILIDCAPTESMLTTAAYMCVDSILVPVKPEFLSTVGLPLLVKSLSDFNRIHRKSVDVLGVVFNGSMDKQEHDRSRSYVRNIAKKNGWDVFKNEVAYSDSYPKGSRLGRPIFLTDYARAYKVSNFFEVAQEFAAKVVS